MLLISNFMTIKKTLISIVLAGALALGAGCSTGNPEYHFNGKIGQERVYFHEADFGTDNILEVVKANGSKIKYADLNNDFKLEYVEITIGDNTTKYDSRSKNPVVTGIVEKAQKEFDAYLVKINEQKIAPLNRK